jgi:acyl-coenzyme A thioesterase PaaI-like protein
MITIFELRQKFLEKFINFYGPFIGAAVRIKTMSKDFRYAKVSMKLTFYNRNYMGTQFGGSLYSMVDPWYMLMLIKNLGKDYIVWDKAAKIEFKKPGRGTVHAEFNLTDEHLNEIKETLKTQNKMDYIFKVEVKDDEGKIIALVDKVVYIRRKS